MQCCHVMLPSTLYYYLCSVCFQFVCFKLLSLSLSSCVVWASECVCVCVVCVLGPAVCSVTGVCCRIVLGIITKKNILEHLEELKHHVEPLVTSPAPLTSDPLSTCRPRH